MTSTSNLFVVTPDPSTIESTNLTTPNSLSLGLESTSGFNSSLLSTAGGNWSNITVGVWGSEAIPGDPTSFLPGLAQEDGRLPYAGYLTIAIYLTFMGLIATVGNVSVIYILLENKQLRLKPNNMMLLSLACSDLGFSVFGYPWTTSSAYAGRWLYGNIGCQIAGFCCTTLAIQSMNILVVMSVVRYILICKPQYQHVLNRAGVCEQIIAATWLYSVLVSVPPLFGWCSYTFESYGISCSMKWESTEFTDVSYTIFLIVLIYGVNIGVMLFCYWKVLAQTTHTLRRLQTMQANKLTIDEVVRANEMNKESKITMMIIVMVVSYIIVWSPYTWVCLVRVLWGDILPLWLRTFPTMFAKSSCAMNPFIYAVTNENFREAVELKLSRFVNRARVGDIFIAHQDVDDRESRKRTAYMVDKTKEGIYIGDNEVNLRSRPETVF